MWEVWVWSLGWEDPLRKGKATHSSILAWRIPWTTVHGVSKSLTRLSDFHFHSMYLYSIYILFTTVQYFHCIRYDKNISSVQSLSRIPLFVTPWTAACQASLSITNSYSLLKLMFIESVVPSKQPSHPLSSPSPPAFNLSQHQGLFQWVSSSHQVAKVLEKEMATHSSILAWRIPGMEAWWAGIYGDTTDVT